MDILPFMQLPLELKILIIEKLDPENMRKFRQVSPEMMNLVDSEMRRKAVKRFTETAEVTIAKTMLMRFLSSNDVVYFPPAVWHLGEATNEPDYLNLRQALSTENELKGFYSGMKRNFGFKKLYTLTFIDILKQIAPDFKVSQIPQKQLTILNFNISGLRMSREWSNGFHLDRFDFYKDCADVLIILRRLLIFKHIHNYEDVAMFNRNLLVSLQHFYNYLSYPIDLDNKLIALKLEQKYQMRIELRLKGSEMMRNAILAGQDCDTEHGDTFKVEVIWNTLRKGKIYSILLNNHISINSVNPPVSSIWDNFYMNY